MRERLIWILAGLGGLLLATALATATNRVTQPPVGLHDAPISAGEALAPRRTTATATRAPGHTRPTAGRTTPPPPPQPPPAPPPPPPPAAAGSDDDGGPSSSGHGSGHDDEGTSADDDD